jgi:hypothetical protein
MNPCADSFTPRTTYADKLKMALKQTQKEVENDAEDTEKDGDIVQAKIYQITGEKPDPRLLPWTELEGTSTNRPRSEDASRLRKPEQARASKAPVSHYSTAASQVDVGTSIAVPSTGK